METPPLTPSQSTLSRRDALRLLGGWGAAAVASSAASPALAATGGGATVQAAAAAGTAQPFVLAPLGYAADALEPHFDRMTMEIHHGRHHRAYVDNANRALQSYPELRVLSAEALMANLATVPESIRMAVRNNVGGHLNHALFWRLLTPGGASAPTGDFAAALVGAFGSVDAFKTRFTEAALGRFGSGWAWLAAKNGKLTVISTPNQDTPGMEGYAAIIGLDVWEHAYYLKFQNRRGDYAKTFWNVLNWDVAAAEWQSART